MPSFQISISRTKRTGGRFAAKVRRELQKAFAEEQRARGLKQADLARELGVHRSVVNRQLIGVENLTLVRVGELAEALGREPDFILRKPESAIGANHIAIRSQSPVTSTEFKPLHVISGTPLQRVAG